MSVRLRHVLVIALAPAAAVLAACDVRTAVSVDVEESGAGVIMVAVGLDADAVNRLPSLDDLVHADDLTTAGWTVSGPDRDAQGITWYRADKPFDTPEEATAILAEISGPSGPFRDFSLGRQRELARTLLDLEGTIDLTGGLGTFSDAALAQSLEGHPLGEPIEQIEARLGESVTDVFSFEFVVRMPGDVESNASSTGRGEQIWTPSLADTTPTSVEASSEVWRPTTVIALVVAIGALVLLLAWIVIRVAIRRRRGPGGRAASTDADSEPSLV